MPLLLQSVNENCSGTRVISGRAQITKTTAWVVFSDVLSCSFHSVRQLGSPPHGDGNEKIPSMTPGQDFQCAIFRKCGQLLFA